MLKTETITSILNNFTKQFDCIVELGTDFAYYEKDNLITYALLVPEENSISFLKNVENLFPNINADIFIWSLMHEIGHAETSDDIEEEEWEEYLEKINGEISDEEYYKLAPEHAATLWAGDFIQSHEDEVRELWNKLSTAIKTFYDAINLEL